MVKEKKSVTVSVSSDRCSVIGCLSRTSGIRSITFHSCPNNPVTQKLWSQSLKLDPKVSIGDAIICSEHFDPSCFKRCGDTVELREGSVPAVRLKRKVRPNPKYADGDTPSKKLKTDIKIETDSDEIETDSSTKNEQTAEVAKKTPSATKIVKRGPEKLSSLEQRMNTSIPLPLDSRKDVVCLLNSPDGIIVVKMEDATADASVSNVVASSNVSRTTLVNATVKERIRESIISKAFAASTVVDVGENSSTSGVSKVTLSNDTSLKISANTIVEGDQNGSAPDVTKVILANDPKLKNVETATFGDKSTKKSNVRHRKVMASDEEVAQWVEDYKADCAAKQAKLEKSRTQAPPPANPRIVPPIASLPPPPPVPNGAPRRFATKLSQCVNEEDDDAHFVISKINFAMTHVQMQDRKIKELNDRYVELTRENDELREEHNSLRAQIAAAAKSKTGGVVSKTVVLSKPVTSAGTVNNVVPSSGSNNVSSITSSFQVVPTTTAVSVCSAVTGVTASGGCNVVNPPGSVVIIRRKNSVEPNTSNKPNVGGGDTIS